MCFNQCSILAHVVDGKVVELKGNPDSPVGRGHICAKGASGIMQLYDPNRITKPMKRTNPKRALTKILAGKRSAGMRPTNSSTKISVRPLNAVAPMPLRACRWLQARQEASCGTRPLALSTATQREAAPDICGAGVHQLEYLHTGSGNAMPDYKYCNYIVQFRNQRRYGDACHGFNMTVEPFSERRKEGLRLVSFDPHMGGSGEQADLWVPILPGTDAAVALAMAYVLVHEENLIDVDFLTNRTNGPRLSTLKRSESFAPRARTRLFTWTFPTMP